MDSTVVLPDQFPQDPSSAAGPGFPAAGAGEVDLPDKMPALHEAFLGSRQVAPDHAAAVMDLSRRLNQPEAFIDKNLPAAREAASAPSADYWANLERQYPGTAKFLGDPRRMVVAKDDVESLAKMEDHVRDISLFGSLWRSLGVGASNFNATLTQIPALVYETAALPQNLAAKAVGRPDLQVNAPEFLRFEQARRYWGEAAQALHTPDLERGVLEQIRRGDISGAGRSIAANVLANAPNQAFLLASAMAGFPGFGLASAGAMQAAGVAQKGRELGMDPASSTINAVAQGTIEAAFENIGTFGILKKWESAIARSFGRETLSRVVKDFSKTLAYSFGSEANEEFWTSAAQDLMEWLTGANPKAMDGWLGRAAEAGIVGGFSGLAMTSPAGVLSGTVRAIDARQTERAKKFYTAMGESAEASKLRQRLPEAQKAYVEQITKDGPVEDVYIPAEAFESYFQSKNINPQEMAAKVGVAEQLAEARETGGDIQIPLATWIQEIVGTEHYKGLSDDVKFRPEEMTARQLNEREEAMSALLQQEADRAVKEQPDLQTGKEAVFEDVVQQLTAVGRPAQEAKAAAAVWANRAVAEAQRRGVTPEEWYRGAELRVTRGGTEQARTSSRVEPGRGDQRSPRPGADLQEGPTSQATDQGSGRPGETALPSKGTVSLPVHGAFRGKTSVFPSPSVPFPESITANPRFVKWLADADAVARKYASERGVEATRDFAVSLAQEIHHDFSNIRMAGTPEERRAAAERVKEKYKGKNEFELMKEMNVLMHASQGLSEYRAETAKFYDKPIRQILDRYDEESRPMAGIEAERSESGDTFFQSRFSEEPETGPARAEFAYWQLGHSFDVDKPYYNIRGEHPRAKSTVTAETLKKLGIEVPKTPSLDEWLVAQAHAKAKGTFFQDPTDPRGFITFTPRETIIGLAKSADASTFMHESAHFWLKDMRDFVTSGKAGDRYKADWKVLADWLGLKDGQEISTEQHERFARGFEAYLLEGKSPSIELKPIFRLFRRWLTRLYKEVSALKVELTDPVRAVMDRLVASEDEIDLATLEMGYKIDVNMDEVEPKARARLTSLQEQAHEEAVNTLLRRQMKELTKEHRDFLAVERQRAEAAAQDAVLNTGEYKAMEAVERAFRDSKTNPRPDARTIAADYIAGKLDERGRESFDMLADLNGYGSGDEMAKKIAAARDVKEEIADFVDRWMSQHQDLRNTGFIREEALRAIHNNFQEELMSLERDIFQGKAKEAQENSQIAQRRRFQAKMDAQIARRRAADIIAQRPVRYAGDYMRYFTAERNNAVEAARAAARKDFERAAEFKRRQMLNHALAREALKAREEIQKIRRYLDNFTDRRQDLKDMPYGFVNQVDRLLSNYKVAPERDWDKSLAITARQMADAGEPLDVIANTTGMVLDGNRWRPEALPEMVKRIQDNYYSIAVPERILAGTPRDHRFIPLSEFRELRTAVEAIVNVGRGYERFLSEFIKADVKTAALAIRSSIEANVGVPYEESAQLGHPASSFREKFEALLRQPGDRFLDLVNLLNLSRFLDGGKDGGPMTEYVYRTLSEAENKKLAMTREMAGKVDKLLTDHFTPKEFKRLRTEKVFFDFLPEGRENLTREEMIALALNMGNEGNRDRILRGYHLEPQQAMRIVNSLTKKEMDFVQGAWDLLESYWPQILEMELRVSGVQPVKVPRAELMTVHGRYTGGYYPIAYDFEKSAEAYKYAEQTNALYKQYSTAAAHTAHGHTKARVVSLSRPVRLSLDVLFRHADNLVHDLSYRKAVIDVNRLLNEKDVRASVANALGPKGMRYIQDSLKAVASDQGEFMDDAQKAIRWLRFGATLSRLGWRPVKLLPDLAINLSLGLQEIGPARLRRAMSGFMFHRGEVVDFVNENSERMRNRSALRDRDLSDLNKRWRGDSTVKNTFFIAMALADEAVSYPLWKEVYDHNVLEHGPEKARHLADETVTRTFGSGAVLDQAAIQRGTEYKKVITWWYSWSSMMFNRAWLGGRIAGLEFDKKNFGAAAGTVAVTMLMTGILPGLVDGIAAELFRNVPGGADEDKRKNRVISRTLSQGFSYVPLLGDMAGYLIDRALGQGASLETPLQGTMKTYLEPLGDLVRSVSPDYDLPERFWEKSAEAVSLAAGVPQSVNAWFFNFLDFLKGEGELTWRDLLTRRKKS